MKLQLQEPIFLHKEMPQSIERFRRAGGEASRWIGLAIHIRSYHILKRRKKTCFYVRMVNWCNETVMSNSFITLFYENILSLVPGSNWWWTSGHTLCVELWASQWRCRSTNTLGMRLLAGPGWTITVPTSRTARQSVLIGGVSAAQWCLDSGCA